MKINLPAKISARRKLKRARGVSLMETVVYVALVAFISILVVESIIALMRTFREVRAARDIGNSAILALDRIAKEVRLADAVGAGGEFATTSSKLVLEYSGVSTTTKEFSLDGNGSLRLIVNEADVGALTSPNVLFTNFWVDQATTSTKTAFRITLTIKDKRETSVPRTATFYGAATMRNLY